MADTADRPSWISAFSITVIGRVTGGFPNEVQLGADHRVDYLFAHVGRDHDVDRQSYPKIASQEIHGL
jgi:hypothetical protein